MFLFLSYCCNICGSNGEQYEFYFCSENKDCSCGIQCRDCVKESPAGSFCPTCLFEVTSTSTRTERNHCSRNCFFCPCCITSPLMLITNSPEATSPFTLNCSVCGWDSFKDSDIVLDRPTGLNAQIKAAKDANRLDLQEFNHRKEYVEKMVNKEKRAKKLNESAYVTFEPFTPLPTHIDAKNEWEVKHPDNVRISTLKQRLAQSLNGVSSPLFSSLQPLRTHLRTNYNKSCHGCSSLLVKVVSKAQSLEFPIKSMAYDKIPRFQVLVAESNPDEIVLRCFNPASHLILMEHSFVDCVDYFIDSPQYELSPIDNESSKLFKKLIIRSKRNHTEPKEISLHTKCYWKDADGCARSTFFNLKLKIGQST